MSGVSELDVFAAVVDPELVEAVVLGTVDVVLQPAPSVAMRANDAMNVVVRVIEKRKCSGTFPSTF